MKNYKEMANTLFERREQYLTDRKRKRKIIIHTVFPICCVCVVILSVFGIWKSGTFNSSSNIPKKDTQVNTGGTSTESKDGAFDGDYWVPNEESNNEQQNSASSISSSTDETHCSQSNPENTGDVRGCVVIDGVTYGQFHPNTRTYTADIYLGDARDFEGTYKTNWNDISAELYTAKEDSDILLVKLGNGGTVFLIREDD